MKNIAFMVRFSTKINSSSEANIIEKLFKVLDESKCDIINSVITSEK